MAIKSRFSYTLPRPDPVTKDWHYCGINFITRNPHDGKIWTGGRDSLLISSLPDSKKCIVNSGHIDWINDIICKGEIIYTASSDRSVVSWGKEYHKHLYYHNDYVKCLANPTATSNIISGGLDRNIIVWDVSQETKQVVPVHQSKTGVYSLATNPEGTNIVYGGPDGLLKILDTRIQQVDSKSGLSLIGHKDTVKSILFRDSTLISGGADSMCKIWDIRTLACEVTLGFDSPVWTLHAPPDRNDLDEFWIGCRDGSVIKTARKASRIPSVKPVKASLSSFDASAQKGSCSSFSSRKSSRNRPNSVIISKIRDVGDKFEQVEGVDCILLAKESNPVTGICVVPANQEDRDNEVWVSTTSPDLNIWPDFSTKRSQIVLPKGSKNSNKEYLSIPYSCVIQQNATACLSSLEACLDSPGAALVNEPERNTQELAPLYTKPIEFKIGGIYIVLSLGPSFVKYAFLNDRRRVVVLDSFGHVSVWDLTRFKRIQFIFNSSAELIYPNINKMRDSEEVIDSATVYGPDLKDDKLFDKVVQESGSLIWVANWCTIDLRVGALTVHIDESKYLDAESYYEDCGLVPATDTADVRINIGRWVLTNLLLKYIVKEFAHQQNRDSKTILESLSAGSKGDISIELPKRMEGESLRPMRKQVSGASAGGSPVRQEEPHLHDFPTESAEPELSPESLTEELAKSDLQDNNVASPERSTTPTNSAGIIDRLKGHMRIKSGSERKWNFGSKKKDEDDDYGGNGDPAWAPERAHRMDYMGNSLENLDKRNGIDSEQNDIRNIVPHYNKNETPLVFIPPKVWITVSQEETSQDVSGYIDRFTSEVKNTESDNQKIRLDKELPPWIRKCIVEGELSRREPVKISFLLLPADVPGIHSLLNCPSIEGKLGELPAGGSRLSANRMLRIRKLLVYIFEKGVVEDVPAAKLSGRGSVEQQKAEQHRMDQIKAESYLEIESEGKVLDLDTTLASLKFNIFKGGPELELRYRRKKR